MTSIGHPEYKRLARIEQAIMRDVKAATHPIEQAWASYTWEPLPDRTQAAVWSRLQSFAARLLDISEHNINPIAQALATRSLSRWLKMLGIDIHKAILVLLDHENETHILLEYLALTAIADATTTITDLALERSYHLLSPADRVACVNRLRKTFQTTDICLNQLPSWAFVDKLPELHRLCVRELQQRSANNALEE